MLSLFFSGLAMLSLNCSPDLDLYQLMKETLGSNNTVWNEAIRDTICGQQNMSMKDEASGELPSDEPGHHDGQMSSMGRDFYSFTTPVIIMVGLIGNAISLKVFTSRVMRRLSSSYYLAMLSASDMLVLLSYVFIDWLDKGLPAWPGGHRIRAISLEGMCHIFLYLSYTTRFSSVWLIVAFTGERYVAICHQQHRKKVCSKRYARRITIAVCVISCLVCLYKPFLSGSYAPKQLNTYGQERHCVSNPRFARLNFVLDSVYGLLLTAVPSAIISAFSTPILRRLVASHRQQKESRLVFKENRIRLEFTIIFLSISSCFVALTIPYLITWCQQFWNTLHPDMMSPIQFDRFRNHLFVTRTIFYLNYCVNFFLYCLTGAYYRREIRSLLKFNTGFRGKHSQNSVILHG